MSQRQFISRFLEAQRTKGNDLGPLFGTLERLANGNQASEEAPAAMWPAVRGGATPEPEPQPAAPKAPYRPAWMVTPEECNRAEAQHVMRTVQDFTRAIERSRPTTPESAQAVLHVTHRFSPSESLTACLNSAECPQTARNIFQLLHELALESIRARGLPSRPDIGVFHLPVELIAAHFQIDRTTVWRNLKPLRDAGILDERDHYDTLRGQTAVTGKVWAVSTVPDLVLSGQNRRVKLTHADLKTRWRDLDRDVRQGRTAYEMTRTEAQQQADRAKREAQAEQQAEARARAAARKAEREAARARGEKVLTGRAAATANAKETKAGKPRAQRPKTLVQQSLEGLKTIERAQLRQWVLAPFSDLSGDVTLTVASRPLSGLDAVFTLPSLPALPKRDRNAAVEQTARALAAAFEDTDNLRFWCWLLWQLIRGCDQGQNWTDDVAHILARVLHDIRHDESMGNRAQLCPAALVVNELRNCGLLDALRGVPPTRAGGRPTVEQPAPLFA